MKIRAWRDWPLARKGLLAVAVPLALLVAALAALVPMERATADAETEARRTLLVQSDIQSVHAQLAEAATGVRGFLLTGREDFLQRYQETRSTLPVTLLRLQKMVRDPEQRRRLDRIGPLAQQKLLGLESLRRQGRGLAPQDLMTRMIEQKKLLDVLRGELDDMLSREKTLVADAAEHARTARQRTLVFVVLAGLVGVGAAFAAVWLFAADIIARVRHLRDEAQRLAGGEWLQQPSPSRDELGQLSQSLVEASRLLKQRAEDTQSARLAAERASAAKSEFLSRTSHELRTPLNAIIGFAELLSDSADAFTQSSARELLSGGRYLQSLIDELLDLACIEAGAMQVQQQRFAVAAVIDESLRLCAPPPESAVQVRCAPQLIVMADRQRLKQVLVNLLGNAFKYGPPEGPVEIEVQPHGGQLRVEVRDRGGGISDQLRDRLFTPFDRLGAERTVKPGVGLGLALSERLMHAMSGRLGVDQRDGGGSVFWFELPQADAVDAVVSVETSPTTRVTPIPQKPAVTQGRVLCVEDHAGNRALLAALLGRRQDVGFAMVQTIAEALQHAAAESPRLVLLDLHLPDGDGASLIPLLRANEPDLPIVILTADALPETRHRVLGLGATAFVAKPIDIPAFHQLLDRLLK